MKKFDSSENIIFYKESVLTKITLSTFNDLLLKIAIFTMFIHTFVISTIIKGLTIYSVVTILKFLKDSLLKSTHLRALSYFLAIFVCFQLLSQLFNLWFQPEFWDIPFKLMVSLEDPSVYLFRKSLFTQSMYLITCVIFFLFTMEYLNKKNGIETLLRITWWGIFLYVAYGFYEFVGFLLTGENVDFISNRIVKVDKLFASFQILHLGGITIQRMDSLAAEPSMFAYSLIPFTILFYYLKNRIYILLIIALLLSTSTTAIVGIVLFILIDSIFFRKSLELSISIVLIISVVQIMFKDVLLEFWNFFFGKLTMTEGTGVLSSLERISFFKSSFNYFLKSDIFHQLFGYGFGYIRSTDTFSTLLVNVGLIGAVAYILFIIYPFFKIPLNSDYRRGLFISSIVLLIITLISVTELYFYHIWFLAALSWYEYLKFKNNT